MAGIKRDAADHYFSLCVRAKAGFKCEFCGKEFPGPDQGLHCAHIVGRRNASTRWSLDNAVSLCYYHHRYFTENPFGLHQLAGPLPRRRPYGAPLGEEERGLSSAYSG